MVDNETITKLKKELEEKYKELKRAIKTKKYNEIVSLIEPGNNLPITKEKLEKNPEVIEILNDLYPDLEKTKFIKIEGSGDLVAYCIQTDLDDSENINISIIKFHKIDGNWKISGNVGGTSFLKKPTEKENDDAIQKNLSDNPDFKL